MPATESPRTARADRGTAPGAATLIALVGALPSLALAAATTIAVNGTVKGFDKPQQVGSIAVEAGKKDGKGWEGEPSFMNGYFTFMDKFRKLDDTYDFNWINVCTKVTGDPTTIFSKIPSMDPETDDAYPHYYSQDEWIKDNKFGSRTLHGDRSYSQFIDFPGRGKGNGFDFSTFLILQDDKKFELDGKKQMLILAGWTWHYEGDDGERPKGTSTVGKEIAVDKTSIDLITTALKNGKDDNFKGWSAISTFTMDMASAPSPGSLMLAGCGTLLVLKRRRRA